MLADNVWDSQAQKYAGDLKKYVSKICITPRKEKVYTLSPSQNSRFKLISHSHNGYRLFLYI